MIRSRVGATLMAVAVTLAVAMSGTPASADVIICSGNLGNAPDGKIAIEGGQFVGNGYPSQGINQIAGDGETVVWLMKWKNRSATTRVIRVKPGQPTVGLGSGVNATYTVNGVNVDNKLEPDSTAKGLKFTVAANTWSPKVRVSVFTGNGSPASFSLAGHYKGSSVSTCDILHAQLNGL
jgi:hypothetical protein